MVSNTKGSASGDFSKTYRIEMTYSDGTVDLDRVIEARQVGACPASVSPGDLLDEKGARIANIFE